MASGQFRSISPRALRAISSLVSVSSPGSHHAPGESILDCVCFPFFRAGRVWWPLCVFVVY